MDDRSPDDAGCPSPHRITVIMLLTAHIPTYKNTTQSAELADIVQEISATRLVQPGRKGRRAASVAERLKLMQPSGPRDPSEGIEDEEQGIISIDSTESGGVSMRCTLLCAGFVLGPSGSSVRAISKLTGADIRSETQRPGQHVGCTRACRRFVIEGTNKSVANAVRIISSAITHYKELCEGAYCGMFFLGVLQMSPQPVQHHFIPASGQSVSKMQVVEGVTFIYQPPPRSKVPHAASILVEHDSSTSSKSPPLSEHHLFSAFSLPPISCTPPTLDTPAQLFPSNPALLRAVSSPTHVTTSRAGTPTLERTATAPHTSVAKPLSFFCYTPKTDRTLGPMPPPPTITPIPLTSPFGCVDEASLSNAFGMATPLQRALQIALCNASEQHPIRGVAYNNDNGFGHDLLCHTGGDALAPPLYPGTLPQAVMMPTPPTADHLLSRELQSLAFGEEHGSNVLQF